MNWRRVFVGASITGGVLLALVFGLYFWAIRHPFIGGVGDRIVLDDFGFRLLQVEERPPQSVGWQLLELQIEVENLARRVDFHFDPGLARLVHPDGLSIGPLPDSGPAAPLLLHAGEKGTATMRFEVPVELRGFQLRMSFAQTATGTSWLAGALNILDTVMFGEQRLDLVPHEQ